MRAEGRMRAVQEISESWILFRGFLATLEYYLLVGEDQEGSFL